MRNRLVPTSLMALLLIACLVAITEFMVPAAPDNRVELLPLDSEWAAVLIVVLFALATAWPVTQMICFAHGSQQAGSNTLASERLPQFSARAPMPGLDLTVLHEGAPAGLFYTDTDGNHLYVNRTYEKMTGCSAGELIGEGWRKRIHPEDHERVMREWSDAIRARQHYRSVYRMRLKEGQVRWVLVKAAPLVHAVKGRLLHYVGSIEDVTVGQEEQQALLEQNRLLHTITDNLPALIAYVDHHQCYRFCNKQYQDVFGRGGGALLGCTVREVLGNEVYSQAQNNIRSALRGERVSYERASQDHEGTRYWRVDYMPDVIEDNKVVGFYVMLLDITQLKMVEHQLTMLARFDSLTGLANRSQFNEKLAEALARRNRAKLQMAVMFIDIDHFKSINDSLGHCAGDEVLKEFAQRLLASVRQTDIVARLAGDEFVIILDGLHHANEAKAVAGKIIDAMSQDFCIGNVKRRVTASIGIAFTREQESDANNLLSRADKALYLAKSAGRNKYEIIEETVH